MAVEYRHMVPGEEQAMVDFWLSMWPGANAERAITRLYSDGRFLEHTFVAMSEGGESLATAHYWLRQIRNAEVEPEAVGCLSHVATRESARRQGHAERLVSMAHEAMERDGCLYSLLFSSEMGVPLYEKLGYGHLPAPYWQGLVSGKKPGGPQAGRYGVREYDFASEGIEPIARVYNAYNRRRPASLVRDIDYWRDFVASHFTNTGDGWSAHRDVVLVATEGGQDADIAGYAFAHISDEELARREFNLDGVFTVSEIGTLPGYGDAVGPLLGGIVERLRPGSIGGRAYLPREPQIQEAISEMFTEQVNDIDDRRVMALPLSQDLTIEQIRAIWTTPGAYFWQPDDF